MTKAITLLSVAAWSICLAHTLFCWYVYQTMDTTLPVGFYPGSPIHIALTLFSPLFLVKSFEAAMSIR